MSENLSKAKENAIYWYNQLGTRSVEVDGIVEAAIMIEEIGEEEKALYFYHKASEIKDFSSLIKSIYICETRGYEKPLIRAQIFRDKLFELFEENSFKPFKDKLPQNYEKFTGEEWIDWDQENDFSKLLNI